MSKTWKISELTNKDQILAYLETDRLYAAYAIGDLEPHLFAQTRWVGAEKDGRLQAIALHFRGLELPVLFLMGDTDGLWAILESAPLPERAYVTCRREHLAMTHELCAWEERTPMWRMVLEPASFRPVKGDRVRLTPAHSDQLTVLYTLGGGTGFSARQLWHGVFYGVFADGRLVATAGTHVLSPTYGMAAVGNVFTHPDYRGQGYGTSVTSAVLAELLERGIRDVVLNVGQDNVAAIRIYERLGFERYCPFLEGRARVRRAR